MAATRGKARCATRDAGREKAVVAKWTRLGAISALRALLPLTHPIDSAPIRRVKFAASLLLLAAAALTACNTHATRREMFAPAEASGPYSEALEDQTWRRGVKERKKPAATPAPKPKTEEEPAA